jgi:GT2 family glycosyltransferase
MQQPATSIVASMYNADPAVLDVIDRLFLPSLLRNAGGDRQLILLDDASPLESQTREMIDRHRPALKAAFGEFVFHRNTRNLGFAGSYNKGLQMAGGRAVLIVNDDVYFPANSITRLTAALDADEAIGAVGPVTNYAAGFQQTRLFRAIRDYSPEEIQRIEQFAAWLRTVMDGTLVPVDRGMIGFCLAVKQDVLTEVGGFDARFQYAMFEDTDLNRRIVASGRRIMLDAATFVMHGGPQGGSMSLAQHPWRSAQAYLVNARRYAGKWGDFREVVIDPPLRLLQFLGLGTVTQNIKRAAKQKGLWEDYRRMPMTS